MKPGDLVSFPKFGSPDQVISALVLEEPVFSVHRGDLEPDEINHTTGARIGSFVRIVKVLRAGKVQNWMLDIDDTNLVINETG